jgi:hypothetical protein
LVSFVVTWNSLVRPRTGDRRGLQTQKERIGRLRLDLDRSRDR